MEPTMLSESEIAIESRDRRRSDSGGSNTDFSRAIGLPPSSAIGFASHQRASLGADVDWDAPDYGDQSWASTSGLSQPSSLLGPEPYRYYDATPSDNFAAFGLPPGFPHNVAPYTDDHLPLMPSGYYDGLDYVPAPALQQAQIGFQPEMAAAPAFNLDLTFQAQPQLPVAAAPPPAPTQAPQPARHNCPQGCRQTFTRAGDYRRHMQKHQAPRFKCVVIDCNKTFARMDKLRDHLRQGHRLRL